MTDDRPHAPVVETPVRDIRIGDRHRKDMGDLAELAESIAELGLLQPVGVTPDGVLVFGERRLRACWEVLGWETIPTRVVQIPSILQGEFAENAVRKEWTVSERVAIVEALRAFRHGGDRRSGQARTGDDGALTVDWAAKLAGLGGKDGYHRAKAVLDAGVPALVEALDAGRVPVSVAAEMAGLDPAEQQDLLAAGRDWTVKEVAARRNRRQAGVAIRQAGHPVSAERPGPAAQPAALRPDEVVLGDCLDLIPLLPDRAVNLVLTSPPYTEQRNGHYPGVPAAEYPGYTVRWLEAVRDKLADDGSVLVVIRPDLKDGVVSDYVLRTRLAVREAGWFECETLIWHKPDGGACMGSVHRPRRTYEEILWFAKTPNPFIDTKACGRDADDVSYSGSPKPGGSGTRADRPDRPRNPGRTKVTDVISVPVRGIQQGVGHPAMFPDGLAATLVGTFCPPGGTVLDPFAGSGTTLVSAKRLGRRYYGFEIEPPYCKMARTRLAAVDNAGPAPAGDGLHAVGLPGQPNERPTWPGEGPGWAIPMRPRRSAG